MPGGVGAAATAVWCVWPQTAAPTDGRLPAAASLFPFPFPLQFPNSHFPQFPFPSRVSNNFAESGGLKHERASHTKDIHRYTHTYIHVYMCIYCMCCIHAPDDGFITFSWHFCVLVSSSFPCPALPCPVLSLFRFHICLQTQRNCVWTSL